MMSAQVTVVGGGRAGL